MKFEWDPEKANTNFSKHGVTFEEATTVFKDRFAMTETDTAHSSDDFSGAVRGKYAARYSTGVALPDYADPDWREKTLVRRGNKLRGNKLQRHKLYRHGGNAPR